MAHDDLQEALQALPPMLNDIVAEAVREDLPRQRRDRDARALALQDVAEVLEVAVPAAHAAVPQLEGRDVGAAQDLVVRVHAAAHAVGARVLDLGKREQRVSRGAGELGAVLRGEGPRGSGRVTYFYLEEVLRRAVDLLEALLARIWHGLHGCKGWAQGRK